MYVCSILGSFIAYGVLHMRGVLGRAGWRWLFLVEGGITLLVGIATFFMMPPGPTQTKAWFRPKGWFTEREEVIAVTRVLRDDPGKGDMHNRQALTPRKLWRALTDYDLWPLYIVYVSRCSFFPRSTPNIHISAALCSVSLVAHLVSTSRSV